MVNPHVVLTLFHAAYNMHGIAVWATFLFTIEIVLVQVIIHDKFLSIFSTPCLYLNLRIDKSVRLVWRKCFHE